MRTWLRLRTMAMRTIASLPRDSSLLARKRVLFLSSIARKAVESTPLRAIASSVDFGWEKLPKGRSEPTAAVAVPALRGLDDDGPLGPVDADRDVAAFALEAEVAAEDAATLDEAVAPPTGPALADPGAVAGLAEAHLHLAEVAEGGLQPFRPGDAAGQVDGLHALPVAAAPDLEEDGAAEGADADLVAVGLEHESRAEEGGRGTGLPWRLKSRLGGSGGSSFSGGAATRRWTRCWPAPAAAGESEAKRRARRSAGRGAASRDLIAPHPPRGRRGGRLPCRSRGRRPAILGRSSRSR